MTHVVFDMDGTLANTEALVVQAYELIGVKVPDGAWGKPASSWLPQALGSEEAAAEAHELKNIAYRVLIAACGVEPLAPADLCRELIGVKDYDVGILTGASYDATIAVRRALRLDNATIFGAGVNLQQKVDILQSLSETGLYFDDNLEACERVADETKWQVLYVEHATTDDIIRGFKEAMIRCKQ